MQKTSKYIKQTLFSIDIERIELDSNASNFVNIQLKDTYNLSIDRYS